MDWEEVSNLLSVIHQASTAGPKFAKWARLAEEELEGLFPAVRVVDAPMPERELEDKASEPMHPTKNGRRI